MKQVRYHTDNLGQVIKEERERQGMSQQKLADLTGVSREVMVCMEQNNHELNREAEYGQCGIRQELYFD